VSGNSPHASNRRFSKGRAMPLFKSPPERRRRQRLKTLPPLALEFQRLMGEVFGESADEIAPSDLLELRGRAASLARTILKEIEELRWDQALAPDVRQMLETTQRRMLGDVRIRLLLKDEPALANAM
jgi:hypothetical protein